MNTLILKFRKAIGILIVSLVCTQYAAAQSQQEGLGLPGDNLNLSAVLDVFQQSKTLEEFESSINSENNKINNLDLNYDGRIDYIKVKDYPDGNLHSIVLQIDVNMNESQDVAVIYTEKRNNGNVDIQIVGDEDLYGKNYVIDLGNNQNTNTPNPGYNGGMMYDDNYGYNNYVAPSNWNIIVYMYSPSYSMWHSPWYWGYYPRRWNAWSPFYWNDYYNHCYHNYGWYSHNYYYGNRNRFRNHHSNWYGRNRHRSNVYHNNRQRGVYAKSYQGRPPVRKPIVGKPVAVTQNIRNVDNRVNSPGNRLDRNKTVSPQVNRVDRVQMQNQRNAKPQETQAAPLRKVENQRIQENNRQQQNRRFRRCDHNSNSVFRRYSGLNNSSHGCRKYKDRSSNLVVYRKCKDLSNSPEFRRYKGLSNSNHVSRKRVRNHREGRK